MSKALLTLLVFLMLGFSLILGGFYSGEFVLATLGAALGFAGLSSTLTLYVISESRLKKATEVVSVVVALGIVVGGYILTGNIILGIITTLIAFLMFIAFMLSYLLPRIQNKRSVLLEGKSKNE